MWLIFFLFFMPLAHAQVSGQELFSNLKDLLVRVKAADSLDSPKASYGTGFVVDRSGILMTNYHVISDYVMQPGQQWKIIVETLDSQNLEAELIAFSVIDDLALIRIKKEFPREIKLSQREMQKGERSFSLGLPHDLNMSLIEGVYNGSIRHGPYETVYVSTPLNSGMSGGPSVDTGGNLIGVNVARVLFANDISFIVPVSRARLLVNQLKKDMPPLSKEEAEKSLYAQLELSQEKLMTSMLESKTQKVEIWKNYVIEIPEYFKCWSSGKEEPQIPYVYKSRKCRLDHAVFLASGLDTGSVQLDLSILEASEINAVSVEKLFGDAKGVASFLSGFSGVKKFGDLDARELFSVYECKNGFLKTSFWGEDKNLRSSFCIRKYLKAKDLYDFSIQWIDFKGPEKVKFTASHAGLSLKNAQAMMAYWGDRLK